MIEQALEYYAEFQEIASNSVFQEWGVLGLFLNALLSATAIPLPTEILTSALLAGGESKLVVSLVLVAGSSIGGLINYGVGAGGGKVFRFLKTVIKPKRQEKESVEEKKSHNLLRKLGWTGVFFSPFIPVGGDLLLMSAGAKKMNFKKFILFMITGKIFKTVIVVGLLGIVL